MTTTTPETSEMSFKALRAIHSVHVNRKRTGYLAVAHDMDAATITRAIRFYDSIIGLHDRQTAQQMVAELLICSTSFQVNSMPEVERGKAISILTAYAWDAEKQKHSASTL